MHQAALVTGSPLLRRKSAIGSDSNPTGILGSSSEFDDGIERLLVGFLSSAVLVPNVSNGMNVGWVALECILKQTAS